jgi:hypothetical protein
MVFSGVFYAVMTLPNPAVPCAWINAAVDLCRGFLHRTAVILLENLTITSHGLLRV